MDKKEERENYIESLELTLSCTPVRRRGQSGLTADVMTGFHVSETVIDDVVAAVTGTRYHPKDLYQTLADISDSMNRYECKLERGKQLYIFPFYMGKALKGEPDIEDILYALLMDASAAESGDFDEFVDAYGYAEPKAAYKAFQACVKTSSAMIKMFSIQELSKLNELFEDY